MGLETDYVDGQNEHRTVSLENVCRVLAALGQRVETNGQVQDCIQDLKLESWRNVVDPIILFFPQEKLPLQFRLTLPLDSKDVGKLRVHVQLRNEEGKVRNIRIPGASCKVLEQKRVLGLSFIRLHLSISCVLAFGYFDAALRVEGGPKIFEEQSLIISAPKQCYLPSSSKKGWGVGVQLYSLRSKKNWGIGDFRDLSRLIRVAGKDWKATTIGLSPLHCLTKDLHSPYSPSSRLFWNPLYLNLEEISEFRSTKIMMKQFRSRKFQDHLQRLRDEPMVNYPELTRIKSGCLERLFGTFQRHHLRKGTRRAQAFFKFVQAHDPSLTRICTFQALCEQFKSSIWKEWPEEFQQPESSSVRTFQKRKARRIRYFQYVQWQCEVQLRKLCRLAKRSHLSLGLYHDLPIGIHPDGADAWVFQEQLVPLITVGAPPDSFNLLGQNWGLQTSSPRALRQKGYQFFRETLRQNMRHGGVLRIDHALGLFRKYLIPQGGTGLDGVYVRMFVDELLAILALESQRHRVMVVGEDLGTVTSAIRQKLDKAGLLSYRLLLFERNADGTFQESQKYPSQALVAATTHDLPTLCGFWVGRDIEVKEAARLFPNQATIDRDWEERAEDRLRLWALLQDGGFCLGENLPLTFSLQGIQAVYRFLAQTPSRLLMVQLEDLLTQLDTPNLPAALPRDYPSWRVKSTVNLEDWLKDPDIKNFAGNISAERSVSRKQRRSKAYLTKSLCAI